MKKGEIQYIADTLLLEKLATIEAGLTKEAGIVDMFTGMAVSIKNEIAERVQKDGVWATLAEYLLSGTVMKLLGPWGFAISLVASAVGFDVSGFFRSIVLAIKDKIQGGQKLSMDEVNEIGKSLAQQHAGPIEAQGQNDFFHYLRKAEAEGKLIRLIKSGQGLSRVNKVTPFFPGGGVLNRIFGGLFAAKRFGSIKWIVAGIILWLIKTTLLGAGVMDVSPAIKENFLGKKEDGQKPEAASTGRSATTPASSEENRPNITLPSVIPNGFNASGNGEVEHPNNGKSVWIVPLLNNSIPKTLISWTLEIYPELRGYEDNILKSTLFNSFVYILNKEYDTNSPGYLSVPSGITSRKNAVDRFVQDSLKSK